MTDTDQFIIDIQTIARTGLETEEQTEVPPIFRELVSLRIIDSALAPILLPVLHDGEVIGRVVITQMLNGVLVVIRNDVGTRSHPQIVHTLRMLRLSRAETQQQTYGQYKSLHINSLGPTAKQGY